MSERDTNAAHLFLEALRMSISAFSFREFIDSTLATFEYHKSLADRAIAQLPDDKLRQPLHGDRNSIAIIMKHVAGNLRSRWTDFLTTDGEKPWRERDQEFVDTYANRQELLADWNNGWTCLIETLRALTDEDFGKTVKMRGEPHSVTLAIQRSLGHTCYHVGQITLLARVLSGEAWQMLTIPLGGSEEFNRKMAERFGK